MKVALLHNHYDEEHLEEVKAEMVVMGAPKIKAVWLEFCGAFAALEGCHRIRAAHALGLTPEIEEVEWSDEIMLSEIGVDAEDDMTIEEAVEDAWKTESFEF
jgi:hypothetical protein